MLTAARNLGVILDKNIFLLNTSFLFPNYVAYSIIAITTHSFTAVNLLVINLPANQVFLFTYVMLIL